MVYRDERGALRERLGELEQDLADARVRLDAAQSIERELLAKQKEIDRLAAELAKYERRAAPARPGVATLVCGSAVAFASIGVGAYFISARSVEQAVDRSSVDEPTSNPITLSAESTAPRSSPTADESASTLRFSLSPGHVVPLATAEDAPEEFVALTFEDGGVHRAFFATLFQGDPPRPKWRAGPFVGGASIRLAASEGGVLVAEEGNALHSIDPRTGRDKMQTKLWAPTLRMCIHDQEVWMDTGDKRSMLLRLDILGSETPQPATRPLWCASESAAVTPTAPGITPLAMTRNERDGTVAVGVKSVGAHLLEAYGLDDLGLVWRNDVAANPSFAEPQGEYPSARFDLRNGLFVALYETTGGPTRVTAFDPKTGRRWWDSPVPSYGRPAHAVSVGARRVYVSQGARLHLFDRATGRLLRTLGEF